MFNNLCKLGIASTFYFLFYSYLVFNDFDTGLSKDLWAYNYISVDFNLAFADNFAKYASWISGAYPGYFFFMSLTSPLENLLSSPNIRTYILYIGLLFCLCPRRTKLPLFLLYCFSFYILVSSFSAQKLGLGIILCLLGARFEKYRLLSWTLYFLSLITHPQLFILVIFMLLSSHKLDTPNSTSNASFIVAFFSLTILSLALFTTIDTGLVDIIYRKFYGYLVLEKDYAALFLKLLLASILFIFQLPLLRLKKVNLWVVVFSSIVFSLMFGTSRFFIIYWFFVIFRFESLAQPLNYNLPPFYYYRIVVPLLTYSSLLTVLNV